MRQLRIALAQINTTVGDLAGNTQKITEWIERSRHAGADLVAFPELAITGYPPEDLLLQPRFIADNRRRLDEIIRATKGLVAIVGFVDSDGDAFNAAAVIHDGKLVGVHHKCYLPNYGVFDENRYFQSGKRWQVFDLDLRATEPLSHRATGVRFATNICEDIWYPGGPLRDQAVYGDAEVVINISASPYHAGKGDARERMIATRAADHTVIVAYCNLVGGQDELVFDGQSLIVDQTGETIVRGRAFEEDLIVADLDLDSVFRMRLHDPRRRKEKADADADAAAERVERIVLSSSSSRAKPSPLTPLPKREGESRRLPPSPVGRGDGGEGLTAEVYSALVLGTRDYVRKNGFSKVCIGLSGGVDSALTAVIAADALGKDNVTCVFMPSQYSSEESREDAEELALRLGVRLTTISIQRVFEDALKELAREFRGAAPNLAEENLQARIRGNLLMALSNKFGYLVLTTGNKSETSVGYSTLYGDTAGGLAVIKDCPKTLVYELAQYRNSICPGRPFVIPERILTKAPTAELRLNQKDTDSLPPYEVLDPILKMYVEEDRSAPEIVAAGFPDSTVRKVLRLVDRAEYKRRQAPPGIKITPRAFGKDRRLPITNAYAAE